MEKTTEEQTDENNANADTKRKILRVLKPKKKFLVSYAETIYYEKEVEAVDKEEAEDMFYKSEIDFQEEDAYDSETLDNSFEVKEC